MFIEQPAIYLRWLYPKAYWRMDRHEKAVYLTFDDGPIPEATPFILDMLKAFGVKARRETTSADEIESYFAKLRDEKGFDEFLKNGKPDKIRKLILAGKDIGGQIDLSLEDMRLCQGLYDLFRGKIIRVSPGAEALAAQIDRIRACAEGTDQRLFASCGRKKLNSMRI